MNEKIKELARKAGGNPNYKAYKDYFMPPPPNHIDPSTVNLEKFAELIVRECAEFSKQAIEDVYEVAVNNHALPDYIMGKIKQHFGVDK